MQTDPISAAHAYRQALDRISRAETKHDAIRLAVETLKITFVKPEPGIISVSSGFGRNTKEPFVVIGMANPTESANPAVQIVADRAREIAMQILEAADAAESDGFIVGWLSGTADLSEGQVGALLADFRSYREQRRKTGEL